MREPWSLLGYKWCSRRLSQVTSFIQCGDAVRSDFIYHSGAVHSWLGGEVCTSPSSAVGDRRGWLLVWWRRYHDAQSSYWSLSPYTTLYLTIQLLEVSSWPATILTIITTHNTTVYLTTQLQEVSSWLFTILTIIITSSLHNTIPHHTEGTRGTRQEDDGHGHNTVPATPREVRKGGGWRSGHASAGSVIIIDLCLLGHS